MVNRNLRGIFCLEGEWDPNLTERASVQPILDLLQRLRIAETVHRDVATREELAYYIDKWGKPRYSAFKILQLACHGDKGKLRLGKDDVTLDDLAGMLAGRCTDRVIYFGSCLTMAKLDVDLLAFVQKSGARAVVGYAKEISWLDSAAFELLLLERMVRGSRTDYFFNSLLKDHERAAKKLGLVVATRRRVYNAREWNQGKKRQLRGHL